MVEHASTALREFRRDLTPTATLCLLILSLILLAAILAPFLAPYREGEILTTGSFVSPGEGLLLGSDYLGRDLFSRLFYGLRLTVAVSFMIAILAFLVGCSLGFLAAVLGGRFDMLISRLVDALIAFPAIMLALIVLTALGPSIPVLVVTIAFIDSTRVFRVARALGVDIVVQDYIEAATVRGERFGWLMWHEILPNALVPLAAEFGIRFTYAILFISALSFLGLGVQPPQADLGVLIRENMQGLLYGTFSPIYPALCIAAITVSINLLVDWYLRRNDASSPEDLQ